MADIDNFVDQIADQDFSKAGVSFNDLLAAKMTDALEAEKVRIADTTFNGVEEEIDDTDEVEEDDYEDDFSDEELEVGAEEAAEEE